jgi:hypothetical protein
MRKTVFSIEREVETVKQVLLPSKQEPLIIHMWLPEGDPRHKMSESEIIAKGYAENRSGHRALIIVPTNRECMPKEEVKKE